MEHVLNVFPSLPVCISESVFMESRQSLTITVSFQSDACRNLPSHIVFSPFCLTNMHDLLKVDVLTKHFTKSLLCTMLLDVCAWFVMHEVYAMLCVVVTHCGQFALIVFFICTADWIWSQTANRFSLQLDTVSI